MVDILPHACRTTSSRNISGRTVSKSVLNKMLWTSSFRVLNISLQTSTLLAWIFQELTGYSENNDQYFETAETADSLRRFETHYNAK